jgi:hypothetical protein
MYVGSCVCLYVCVVEFALTCNSVIGGLLMAVVGIAFLIYEDQILADFSRRAGNETAKRDNLLSRTFVGIQVSRPRVDIEFPSLSS